MELNIRALSIGEEVSPLGEVIICPHCHNPGVAYEGGEFTCIVHQCRVTGHTIELIEGCLLQLPTELEQLKPRQW